MAGNALLVLMAATASTAIAAPLRVMFVGNSFTFVNDLPQQLQNIASSKGVTIDVSLRACAQAGKLHELHHTYARRVPCMCRRVMLTRRSQRSRHEPLALGHLSTFPWPSRA